MIVCQTCQKNAATVHVTEIVGGEKRELHFCESCAREQNITGIPLKSALNVNELLSSLVGQEEDDVDEVARKECPDCGMTYIDFRSGGRLGCARDYQVFEDELEPLIEKIHGAVEHVGKTPRTQDVSINRMTEIRRVKAQLRDAVAREDYEEAAALRDKIKELEG